MGREENKSTKRVSAARGHYLQLGDCKDLTSNQMAVLRGGGLIDWESKLFSLPQKRVRDADALSGTIPDGFCWKNNLGKLLPLSHQALQR